MYHPNRFVRVMNVSRQSSGIIRVIMACFQYGGEEVINIIGMYIYMYSEERERERKRENLPDFDSSLVFL